MFIDTAKFKKELKQSYDGLGVEVIHFADDIVRVSGSGWIIEVGEWEITNKFLSALAEYIGPLPRAGKGYSFKDKTREDIVLEYENLESGTMLMRMYTEGTPVEDTRLMIQRYSTCYSVFQTMKTREPMLVRRNMQVVVDGTKINEEHDELPPGNPVLADNMIIWNNDSMQFAVATTPVHNAGERDFLRLINGKDMHWPFED
jgi:hypothetical protein